MKLIDKDAVIELTWEEPSYTDPLNVLTEVRDRIKELPTIDAVPVIRCKECKYHLQTERNGFVYWSQCNHPHWDLSQGCQLAEVDDTDFCSWGERKDNG